MAAGQLWLFDPPKPLVERLGQEYRRWASSTKNIVPIPEVKSLGTL